MSSKLITASAMQKQAERIKLILNDEGTWALDGNTATFGSKYSNANPPVTLQGVNATNVLFAKSKAATINSQSPITICGTGGEFNFADLSNVQIKNAADSVQIFGLSGNDTVLNTGVAVSITTGADGSSSISDYAPYSDYTSQLYSRGNADTIYIDEAAYTFCRDSLCNNDKQIFSFGDKATVATYKVSVPTATDLQPKTPDNFFIKRGKGMCFQSSNVNYNSGNSTIRIGSEVSGCIIIPNAGNDQITIDSGAGGNIYQYNQFESGQTSNDTIYGWNATDNTLRIYTSASNVKYTMSKDGKDLNVSIKGGGTVKLTGLEPTNSAVKTRACW